MVSSDGGSLARPPPIVVLSFEVVPDELTEHLHTGLKGYDKRDLGSGNQLANRNTVYATLNENHSLTVIQDAQSGANERKSSGGYRRFVAMGSWMTMHHAGVRINLVFINTRR
jgi:hypothetical protein